MPTIGSEGVSINKVLTYPLQRLPSSRGKQTHICHVLSPTEKMKQYKGNKECLGLRSKVAF